MTRHTPLSRLVLGSLITIVVAAIMVVASSRSSKSDVALTLSIPSRDEAVGGPRTTTRPGWPGVAGSPQTVRSTAMDAGADDAAKSRSTEPVTDAIDSNAATEVAASAFESAPAASPEPAPSQKKSAPKKQDSVGKPAGKQEKEAAKQQEADEARPLRQLSRQFARRRAAQSGDAKLAAEAAHNVVEIPAEEVVTPSVAMSQEHRNMCRLFIGDQMPAEKLPNGSGQEQTLADVLGEKLTVIIFWHAGNPYAQDQFNRIRKELVPWADKGVRTVAIHVGAAPDNYDELCRSQGDGVVCLLDADEAFFQQVATAKLPRTYLLDAEGTVVWLDMEYSRSTRHDLLNAMQYFLRQ